MSISQLTEVKFWLRPLALYQDMNLVGEEPRAMR